MTVGATEDHALLRMVERREVVLPVRDAACEEPGEHLLREHIVVPVTRVRVVNAVRFVVQAGYVFEVDRPRDSCAGTEGHRFGDRRRA